MSNEFLTTDTLIYNTLQHAKTQDGNKLLQYFKITYPEDNIATTDNNIIIAAVNDENRQTGFEFTEYNSLVEISIRIKQTDYLKSMRILKTVTREILRVLKDNDYRHEVVVRNIHYTYNNTDKGTVLRGCSMLLQMKELEQYHPTSDDIEKVCELIIEEIRII